MFIELSPDQARQYIDATAVFTALEQAKKAAMPFRGSMMLRHINGAQYIIRTTPSGGQTSLGRLGPENSDVVDNFMNKKKSAEDRVKSLAQELTKQQRLNRALRVGRVPTIVVDALNAINQAGLSEHFMVVGTHALYAYETAASVLIPNDAMATRDVDLLLDTRKQVKFVTQMKRLDSSFLGVLQKADKTFRLREDQLYTAVNDKGFEVDVIRRSATTNDPRPFDQVVVSTSGSMARMRTVHPLDFARLKRELGRMPTRDRAKYRKDLQQADAVVALVHEYLPHLSH